MLVLENKEKIQIKKFINTNGYVFNFTTKMFDSFTFQSIGIKLCERYGLSKGKSFELFVDEMSTGVIIKLLTDLLDYYDLNKDDFAPAYIKTELYATMRYLVDKYHYYLPRVKEDSPIVIPPKAHKYDVFISHATKDKPKLVDAIQQELAALGINIWYDRNQINWGDSLTRKISDGLENSKYGIVVLSRSYFSRNWCEKELRALLLRQEEEKNALILPILYNITISEVTQQYPFLQDIKMYEYKDGAEKDIAIAFANILIKDLKNTISAL